MRVLVVAALCAAALGGCSDSGSKQSGSTDPIAVIDAAIAQSLSSGQVRKADPAWKTKLPKFPDVTFAPGKSYFWDLETTVGSIRCKLFADIAPNHVANTIYLTRIGFYDGLTFHRVIPGFMAQGGDSLGNGTGSPGYKFAGEFSPAARHDRPFRLSMANQAGNPVSDGSQFFITFVPYPAGDDKHTIFGEVVEGTETVAAIERLGSPPGVPRDRIEIVKASIRVE